MSAWWFTAFVLAVGLERLAELVVSNGHAAWAMARGGREYGSGHYPAMVTLHTGLLVGAVVEVWALHRPFRWWGWVFAALVVLTQALRWWCIRSLGPHWNTRVIVVPGMSIVRRGPYRWLSHPNYVVVVVEGIALPLVHGAWLTAAVFTVLNALLLRVRIRVEAAALAEASTSPSVAQAERSR